MGVGEHAPKGIAADLSTPTARSLVPVMPLQRLKPAEATKGHPQSLGLSTSRATAVQKQGPCFSPPYSPQPWTAWSRLPPALQQCKAWRIIHLTKG